MKLWIEDDITVSAYSEALRAAELDFTVVAEPLPPFALGAVHAIFIRREDAEAYIARASDRAEAAPIAPPATPIVTVWLSPYIAWQGPASEAPTTRTLT